MNGRCRLIFWNVAIGILAVMLVVNLVGSPRRLPPDWMTQQTWSMRWEGPDGKPLSTNFIYQTFRPRREFGPAVHEFHWFGPPTIDIQVTPGMPVLRLLPVQPPTPPTETKPQRLSGKFIEKD